MATAGRPALHDFVRLKTDENDLQAGAICQVVQDDEDSQPYKLREIGSSSDKRWFRVCEVEKVEKQRRPVPQDSVLEHLVLADAALGPYTLDSRRPTVNGLAVRKPFGREYA